MDLSPEDFERLLNWLHMNRDEAGREYERIRLLLVKYFLARGFSNVERLADLTIDRAARTLTNERINNWEGNKEKYFSRVAYYTLLEDRVENLEELMPEVVDVAVPAERDDRERRLICLEKCLEELPDAKRDLISRYYVGEKAIRIRNREELARQMKVDLLSLRVRALRIRKELKPCIEKCLSNAVESLPAIVMQAVVSVKEQTPDGHRIQAVTVPWLMLIREIQRDPGFLNQIHWRKLEELVAGAYEKAGFEVDLTPRSADRGRDIIAVKRGVCSIRIIDQVKAYAPHRKVTANDVRALIGVLSSEQNTSKGIVTTTAAFAPGIWSDPTIKPFMPYRLELRNGEQLREWLVDLAVRRDL